MHAFIGPNDSGKSTLLRGIRTVLQLAGEGFSKGEGGFEPFDPGISPSNVPGLELSAKHGRWTYWVIGQATGRGLVERVAPSGVSRERSHESGVTSTRPWPPEAREHVPLWKGDGAVLPAFADDVRPGARLLRLDPDALRAPSSLIAGGGRVQLYNERGNGLAGIYDVILNRHLDGYIAIRDDLRRLFPGVQTFGLENVSESEKELRVQLLPGDWIPARFVSEGLLYYLAFAAIRFLDPASVLLIEEPENGLHPARIAEVIAILREISKTTQVLLATHSPLVINELAPEEVTVVTRSPEQGTKLTPMVETANFEKRSSVYALGELWLSFADGVAETALLHGRDGQ
ncbi:MAG: ATP-binding protein [Polyangiaceae bacterium]